MYIHDCHKFFKPPPTILYPIYYILSYWVSQEVRTWGLHHQVCWATWLWGRYIHDSWKSHVARRDCRKCTSSYFNKNVITTILVSESTCCTRNSRYLSRRPRVPVTWDISLELCALERTGPESVSSSALKKFHVAHIIPHLKNVCGLYIRTTAVPQTI